MKRESSLSNLRRNISVALVYYAKENNDIVVYAVLDCRKKSAWTKDNDEIIAYDEAREIFAAATEAKQFLEMPGGHNCGFIVSGASYVKGPKLFVNESL